MAARAPGDGGDEPALPTTPASSSAAGVAPPAPGAGGAAKRTPWWAYAAVCFAICCMSWGGPLFGLMVDTPVAMRVAWRLSIAATLQLAGLAADWRRADATLRARWVASLPLLALNGVILAAHFIAFAGSVELTSFTNSMLLVSTVPTVFVLTGLATWGVGAWLRGRVGAQAAAAADLAPSPEAAEQPPAMAVPGIDANATRPPLLGALAAAATSATIGIGGGGAAAAFTSSRELLSSVSIHDTAPAAAAGLPAALRELSTTHWHEDEASVSSASWSAAPPSKAASPHAPPAKRRRPWDARLLGWLRGSSRDPLAPLPPTLYEVAGTAIATAGMAALVLLSAAEGAAAAAAAAASSDAPPVVASRYIRAASPTGDVIALVSAACMAAYLAIGRSVRPWMPIWMYMCPTLWTAAVVAATVSLTFEPGTSLVGDDDAALFGWLFSGRSAVIALSAGIVPTILGHAVANATLTWVSPLVISVMSLAQAVIGGLYAYALGVTGAPSLVTLGAGPVIIGGIALVVTGSRTSPCPLPPPGELLAAVAGCGSGGSSGGKASSGTTATASSTASSLAASLSSQAVRGDDDEEGKQPYTLTSAVSIAVPGGDGDGTAPPAPSFDVRPAR
jgi:trimeric autotransporter adhesin